MVDVIHRRPEGPGQPLSKADLDADPVVQLHRWLESAAAAGTREPNAMTLATADALGAPSARVVLLRGLDSFGLTWYTNRQSLKGRDLADNPRAALVFHWECQQRQVRVAGSVTRVAEAEAEVVLVVDELVPDDDDEDDEDDSPEMTFDSEPDGARLRAHINVTQAARFIVTADELMSKGRPPCKLCGQPLDPTGHACPRLN